MNKINLIGRLGSDIELRYTPSGKAVANVNLAVDDGWGDNKKTVWAPLTLWDKTAEIAAKYTSKGRQVGISGRLTQEEWEDKDTGKKRTKIVVTVEQLHLLSGEKQTEQRQQQGPRTRYPNGQSGPPDEDLGDGDDLPF